MTHGRSLGFASLLAALALAAPASAAIPGPEGPLVFVNDHAIQRVEPVDGTRRAPVFRADGDWAGWTLTAPTVSPDGQRVAFAARQDGDTRIAVVALDGSGAPQVVVEAGDAAAPSWSPDGRELVYSGAGGLYRVKATGGEPERVSLPDSVLAPMQPAWSPDGSRLAFSAVPAAGGVRRIYVRGASGAVSAVTGDDVAAEWPSWAPDGERVAYVAAPGTATDPLTGTTYSGFTKLRVRPVDGGAVEEIHGVPDATHGVFQGRASFAPSGKRIGFAWRFPNIHEGCYEYIQWRGVDGGASGEARTCNPGGTDAVDWGTRATSGDIRLMTGHLGSATVGANGAADAAIVSGDGRYAVFASRAWDLIDGLEDRNESYDIFRRDLATGKTVPVSVKEDGTVPDPEYAQHPVVSRDGRWIAFQSSANDLVSGNEADRGAVYLRDVDNGTTTLVSRMTPTDRGRAGWPLAVSDDGTYVLYTTGEGGTAYRFDRTTQSSVHIHSAGGGTFMSADGRYVAYSSESGVYLRDLADGGETTLVASGEAWIDGLSEDGQTVLWRSNAQDTVPGFHDNNGIDNDVYIRRGGAPAQLVTGTDGSATEGSHGWTDALLSADGKTVVFSSDYVGYDAAVVDDGKGHDHVWARRFDPGPAGKASLVVGNRGSDRFLGDGDDRLVAVSADGRHVLVNTTSTTITDPPVRSNDFGMLVRADRSTREAIAVSADDNEANDMDIGQGALSRDGRVATFTTSARNLVKGFEDNNDNWDDAFVWTDRSLSGHDPIPPQITLRTPSDGAVYRTGQMVLADYACSDEGASGLASCDGSVPNGQPLDTSVVGSFQFTVTARDGAGNVTTRTVAYRVAEPNDRIMLASPRAGGAAGESANGDSQQGVLSADGRYLVFESRATDLLPGFVDGNDGATDVFRRDLVTGETRLVSGAGTRGGNGWSQAAAMIGGRVEQSVISADGRYVLFESVSTDLIDGFTGGTGNPSLYLRDMQTGEIRLVDHAWGHPKRASDGFLGYDYWLSRDGNAVAFRSTAKDLVPGVVSGRSTIYVYDVAQDATSAITGSANGDSGSPQLSADGQRVLFASPATNLIPGHTQSVAAQHVYWHDRGTGVTKLVDHRFNSDVTASASGSGRARLSGDGRTVLFESQGDDLIAGMTGHDGWTPTQLYTRDLVAGGAARLITSAFDDPRHGTGGTIGAASLSDDGTTVVWRSRSTRVVPGFVDHNGAFGFDLFVRRAGEPARLAVHGAEGASHGSPASLNTAGLSADGRLLAYTVGDTVTEGPEPPVDVRRVDLARDRVVPIATAPDHWIGQVQTSLDGQRVAFTGNAQNLVDPFVDGNGDEAFDVFVWGDKPPVAKATSRVTGPLTVRFDASGSTDPDGGLVAYRWDFGDGATGTGVNATHTYAAEGTYTARLTVEDDGSHEVSTTLQVIAITGVLAADGAPFDFLGVDRSLGCNALWSAGSVTCATLAEYGGVVYGRGATAFTPVSQELLADRLVTVVALGNSGVRLRQTDAYSAGEGWYRTDIAVLNAGDDARGVAVYRVATCALGAPATRAPVHDAGTAMAGCGGGAGGAGSAAAVGALLPLTAGARHQAGAAGAVLADVAAGRDLSDACECAATPDPGAAIAWRVTVPAHGERSQASLASFGPDGSIPVTVAVTPEHDAVQPLDDNAFTVTLRNPNAGAAAAGGVTVTPDAWDYVAGSTTGLSTGDPSAASGKLTWGGAWSVPGHGAATLRFGVTHRAGERVSTTTALTTGGRFAGVTSTALADIAETKATVNVRSVGGSLPNTAISGGPTGPTSDDSPSFELVASKEGVHYECRLGGDWEECASPYRPGPLRDGDYTLEVRAVDAVGTDPSPATRAFSIDTIAPNTTIATGPRAVGTDPRPVFELRASEPGARFQCRLDGGWTDCATPYRPGLITDGAHHFAARAIDAAGNADATPATWDFEIDTTPPVTVIDGVDGAVLGESRSSVAPSTSSGKVAVGGDGAAALEIA
ncbi:MAG TPA: PKD domain-containing protein, partial [Solirubrobacter sp.]|nr:PKD domain-containing protein [Solirubrobacter sp.]